MTKWLQAIFLMCSSKKGVSSHQLLRTLETHLQDGLVPDAPHPRSHADGALAPFGGGGGTVEADETFIGRDPDAAPSKTPIRNMNAVMTLIDRDTGRARSQVMDVSDINAASIAKILTANVAREARLMTDEGTHYITLGRSFADHDTVSHSRGRIRPSPRARVHSNTVEGFYSIFKRGMKGVYQHCAKKHLHRYVAEFDFRYSNRIALGVDDQERARPRASGCRRQAAHLSTTGRGHPSEAVRA